MSSAANLIVGTIMVWVVGLAPALIIRYLWKKAPLSSLSATWTAGLSCSFFAISFLIIDLAAGEAHARIRGAWLLIFWASRATMMRGMNAKQAGLAAGLTAMIADPATTEDRRALATEKLRLLQERRARRTSAKRRSAAVTAKGSRTQSSSSLPPTVAPRRDGSGQAHQDQPLSSRMRRFGLVTLYFASGALLLNVLLVLSNYRVLVHQQVVKPGETYVAEGSNYRNNERTFIVCRYWTGRSLKPWLSWYGFGKREIDECPFLFNPTARA